MFIWPAPGKGHVTTNARKADRNVCCEILRDTSALAWSVLLVFGADEILASVVNCRHDFAGVIECLCPQLKSGSVVMF